MSTADTAFDQYVRSLNEALRTGHTTEHTHRHTLQTLIDALVPGVKTVNEPGRIKDGSPDILIRKGETILGYVETKDIGVDLSRWPRSDQGKRYLAAYENMLLTDYVDFKWFVEGQERDAKSLGSTKGGKLATTTENRELARQLIADFLSQLPLKVAQVDELARRMAAKAREIKEHLLKELRDKDSASPLFLQLEAFRQTLLRSLTEEEFADMYAQTLAYGLFAARAQHDTMNRSRGFTLAQAAAYIPQANPFLRQLFRIGGAELVDMKEVAWLIEDLVQLLKHCDLSEVMRDFGRKMGREDPVVDLYETFLKHYDPTTRERRGVYYTPEPVVSYIVRSIDELLIKEFGKPLGLADPEVMILDPAVGTGTFLYYTVKLIHQRIIATQGKGAWKPYVREKLLPRIFGFELLMAPYTICHLKLGLLLQDLGYEFDEKERLNIFLTNALEPGIPRLKGKDSSTMFVFADEIAKEAQQAADVKTNKPIWVVMGNPPYSGHSANKGQWINDLLKGKVAEGAPAWSYYDVDGKPLGERNPKWLQDDYVKFLRFAQWRIEKTGHGIVGMITNHGWLDNPTFRGMREKLLRAFDDIYVLDLHGNAKKKERAPDGGKDENVFDIQQGVAISLLLKRQSPDGKAVHHADLWGLAGKQRAKQERDLAGTKYDYLGNHSIADTEWARITPQLPFLLMVERDEKAEGEYSKGVPVNEIFAVSSVGFVTSRDSFVIDFARSTLEERVREFFDADIPDHVIREKYGLRDTRDWQMATARKGERHNYVWKERTCRCLYRPFDQRWTYYGNSLIEMPRPEVMRHMLGGQNLALITVRQVAEGVFNHVLVADTIVESRITLSNKGIAYVFPIELDTNAQEPAPNVKDAFFEELTERLGGTRDSPTVRSAFNYIYAILHSPTYRERYAEFLKMDFPRIPLTSSGELFSRLAELGGDLVDLHLLRHEMLAHPITKFEGMGDGVVRKVRYHEDNRRVCINETQYFTGVEPKLWEFQIGGYQVLYKWLKDREKVKRKLSYDEIDTYCRIVTAIDETIRLMAEIDRAIPSWPIE